MTQEEEIIKADIKEIYDTLKIRGKQTHTFSYEISRRVGGMLNELQSILKKNYIARSEIKEVVEKIKYIGQTDEFAIPYELFNSLTSKTNEENKTENKTIHK